MKRILLVVFGILAWAGVAAAQAPPPNIKVAVAMEKDIFYPPDPIKLILTLENQGDAVITSRSFLDQDFHLLLRFTGEDGVEITSHQLKDMHDPPPPRVLLIGNELVQVEVVEVLAGPPAPWVLSLTIADARSHYQLLKGGKYSVRAVIPMGTYAAYDTVSDVKFARIDSGDWAGSVESAPAIFTLVADADHDGYYYPLAFGEHSEVDCDDSDASVHPGAAEIANNGKDDDCNPGTPDVPRPPVIPPGDLNGDGKTDCDDLAIVRASFGKRCGQPGFDSRADYNHDCVIDIRDLAFVSRQLSVTRCP